MHTEDTAVIRQAMRSSVAGKVLAERPRWKNYYDGQPLDVWTELLGPSAVISTHQEYFAQFVSQWAVREFLTGRISEEQYRQLLRAAEEHDIGEAVVGDTPHPEKTEESDKAEFAQALVLIQQLDVSSEKIAQLKKDFRDVVMGEDVEVGLLFKALEKTEYLDTAIHVFQALKNGAEMARGWDLVMNVLMNDLPKIISVYAKEFPYSVGAYLKNNMEVIDQMFLNMVEHFAAPKLKEQYQFANSWRVWWEYTATERRERALESA